jgi:hypothetical protein
MYFILYVIYIDYFIRKYNGDLPPDDPKDPGSKVYLYIGCVYVVECY